MELWAWSPIDENLNINVTDRWILQSIPEILRSFPHSGTHYFERRVDRLIRIAMPRKIRVRECVTLVSRMSGASAFDVGSAVRTSAIKAGIVGVNNHLKDMMNAGLIERKPGKVRRLFVDESNATNVFVPFDQIDAVRERSIREMVRQATDKAHARKVILDFLGIKRIDEIYGKLYGEDKLFSQVVDVLRSKRLLDRQYRFDKIGWRNGSHKWYLSALVLSLI